MLFGWNHSYHLSVCEINHIQQEKAIQISLKVFADDLEEVLLNSSPNLPIDILNSSDDVGIKRLIINYVNKNLSVKVNGKYIELVHIGNRLKEDVMVIYLEGTGINKVKEIEVTNSVFVSSFNDQVNIVHVKKDGNTKSLKLDKNNISETIKYE